MELIRYIRWLMVFTAILGRNVEAFTDSTQSAQTCAPILRLRSIQADFTSIYFINAETISADIDLANLTFSKQGAALGVRLGIEYIKAFGFEHEVEGSPLLDYNLFIRSSSLRPCARMDAYAGYVYRTGKTHRSYSSTFTPEEAFIIGFDLKWMLIDRFFGLMLKVCIIGSGKSKTGSDGLGFVISWDP